MLSIGIWVITLTDSILIEITENDFSLHVFYKQRFYKQHQSEINEKLR